MFITQHLLYRHLFANINELWGPKYHQPCEIDLKPLFLVYVSNVERCIILLFMGLPSYPRLNENNTWNWKIIIYYDQVDKDFFLPKKVGNYWQKSVEALCACY